jgi:hypothetical protein
MYKLRYGRNYNLGNFETERIEIEREFSNVTPAVLALKVLDKELNDIHTETIAQKAIAQKRGGGK